MYPRSPSPVPRTAKMAHRRRHVACHVTQMSSCYTMYLPPHLRYSTQRHVYGTSKVTCKVQASTHTLHAQTTTRLHYTSSKTQTFTHPPGAKLAEWWLTRVCYTYRVDCTDSEHYKGSSIHGDVQTSSRDTRSIVLL